MNDADEKVAALAERQFGAFSREQAAAKGISERSMSRRVTSGSWVEVFPGVYRLPGATRTGRQRAMAAVLWGGDESAISHTTAGRLLRLDAVRTNALHLTLPVNFGRRGRDLVLHRMVLPPSDLLEVYLIRTGAPDGTDQRGRSRSSRGGTVRARASGLCSYPRSAPRATPRRSCARVAPGGEAGAPVARELTSAPRTTVSRGPLPPRLRLAGRPRRLRVRRFRAPRFPARVEA